MQNIWRKIKTTVTCIKLTIRIGGLLGGVDALAAKLSRLENEILSAGSNIRCNQCGSTELEPTATRPWRDGVEVYKYRCKACGQELITP